MHVIIVTFDNTDPMAFGPYDTAEEARLCRPGVELEILRRGILPHHIDAATITPLIGARA